MAGEVNSGYDEMDVVKQVIRHPMTYELNLMESDGLSGYILLSGYVTERRSKRVVHSFEGVGHTKAGMSRRDALQEGLNKGVNSFLSRMLQSSF